MREELRAGRKTSHWIWFVFPQLRGLGQSFMAHNFGLSGVDEASLYLGDPVLGPRLEEAASLVLSSGRGAVDILGETDALKLRSSMTLFEAVEGAPPIFTRVLTRLYDGNRCPFTRERVDAA